MSWEAELWIIDDSQGGAPGRLLKEEKKKRAVHLSVGPASNDRRRYMHIEMKVMVISRRILMILYNHRLFCSKPTFRRPSNWFTDPCHMYRMFLTLPTLQLNES